MTKEDFLIVSDLLTGFDFDTLDKVEFFMGYERKSNTKIPDEWFAEADLQKPEKTTDWSSFRREAAKDILAGMLSAPVLINIEGKQLKTFEDFANAAIGIADALIAKLKEK